MTILSSQFNLLLSIKLGIQETDAMMIDEFDLVVNLYDQYLKRMEMEK
jgi:hypothetical protein